MCVCVRARACVCVSVRVEEADGARGLAQEWSRWALELERLRLYIIYIYI